MKQMKFFWFIMLFYHYYKLTCMSQVLYDANGFLERNRDNLNQDLVSCLLNSNNDFIKDLFTASLSETGTISE